MPPETPRIVPCPSCRANIEVDPEGNPTADEIAHFSLHENPATPDAGDGTEPRTNETVVTAAPDSSPASPPSPVNEPTASGFLSRLDANLRRALD